MRKLQDQTPTFAPEVDAVVERCRQRLITGHDRLICIDGRDGAGKSTFARYLAFSLGVTCYETDEFVVAGKGFTYRPALGKLLHFHLARNQPVIVDGILAVETLRSYGLKPDLLIRLKRVGQSGDCFSQEKFNEYESKNEAGDVVILPCHDVARSGYDCLLLGREGQTKCTHCKTPTEANAADAQLWWPEWEPPIAVGHLNLAD